MDVLTKEQRRRNMQAIKSRNTNLELKFGRALWRTGLRYRKNDRTIFGKPDFAFKGKKIAVFCDSEFWHGKDWNLSKHNIKSNKQYWLPKIERNIARDLEVNSTLESKGWIVLRFWGNEIQDSVGSCVDRVKKVYILRGTK